MELRHLRYFVSVARAQSFTKAATKLRIAQPALSRQVQDLEEEIGVDLFRRSPRGVTLTAEGELLLEEAEVLLRQAESTIARVQALARGEYGEHGSARNVVLADFHSAKYITFNPNNPLGINSKAKQFTMQKLAGKVAVITGGSSGISLAAVKTFIEEGAYVFISGRRETELAKAKTELGKNVTTVRGDVANLADLDRLYETIKTKKGTLDVVVANAGIVEMVPTAQVTPEHYDKIFNVNARGTFFTVQKALPLLKNGSSIVLVGSGVHTKGFPLYVTYAATKAAMRSFVRSWAADFKDRGIRVNILSPGPTDTPIIEGQFKTKEEAKGMKAHFAQMVPLARLGRAEEMAKAILFLASDDSSYSTGIDLVADGGITQL